MIALEQKFVTTHLCEQYQWTRVSLLLYPEHPDPKFMDMVGIDLKVVTNLPACGFVTSYGTLDP